MFSLITSCTSNYWENRRQDLTVVAHVDLEGLSFGAMANISVISGGLFFQGGPCGTGFREKYGLGGTQSTHASGGAIILGVPLMENSARSRWGYGRDMPHFASVGVDTGLFFGIGARVDLLELLDFVFGFAMIDIVQDDREEEVVIDLQEDGDNGKDID